MKAALRLLGVLTMAAAGTVIAFAAHTHVPTPSTWTLNVKASDFGGGPAMKSDVITLLTDTEKWLKDTDVMVDDTGTTLKSSWSGPQDGTFKPVTGIPGAKAEYKTDDDSSVMIMPGGEEFDCLFSFDSSKKKVTQTCTAKAGGKSFKQKLVYDRTK